MDLESLTKTLSQYFIKSLMSDEADASGCFLEIRAGAGGVEACDWVGIISRMYMRWGADQGYQCKFENQVDYLGKIVDEMRGEVAGYKSITIEINGQYAYGWCRYESGVHRFVRISPFDSQSKRHTSFASVQVYPLIDDALLSLQDISIPTGDIKLETMRSQGAGGQHVNKTESAVRITHLPTGISVACESQRSQHQNKTKALQMLKSRLYEQEMRKRYGIYH